jgi:hypothetical protein
VADEVTGPEGEVDPPPVEADAPVPGPPLERPPEERLDGGEHLGIGRGVQAVAPVVDALPRHLEAGRHATRRPGPLEDDDPVTGQGGAPRGRQPGRTGTEDGDRGAQELAAGTSTGATGPGAGHPVVASPT